MERLSFKEWQVLSDLEVLDSIPEDFEFSMARGELKTIKRSVDRIMKHLGGEGDLEAWVQSKITKANDYLNSVSNHMDGGEDDTKKEVKEGKSKCDCDCGKVPCVECGGDHHKNELKEEKCGDGMYYCKTSKKCKKIPKGYRVGKDGMLVKGVRWQDSDGDGKWYEPGDDVSEGSNPSFEVNKKKEVPEVPTQGPEVPKDMTFKTSELTKRIGKNIKKIKNDPNHPVNKLNKKRKLSEGAVEDLEKGMETLKSITYDSIDGLMKKIAEDHDISTTKLHYMFKAKHDMTPDDWAEKNLKEEMSNWRQDLDEKCWKGYEKKGMKTMFGKRYPNCVKKEEVEQVKEGCDCECGKDPCECKKKKKYYGGSSAKPGPDKNYVKPMGDIEEETIELTDAYGETFATVVDVVKAEPIKTVKSNVEYETYDIESMTEAVRIPSKTGHIVMVNLGWRGKYYSIKMFFPQMGKPSRQDVQDQINKVYPGGKLYTFIATDYEPGEPLLHAEGAAWTKKEGKSKSGGLNEKGRKSYERENPGSDLKAPSKKVGNPRRASFCARMKGMKKKLTSKKTANDPDSRINKSLRAWNC